MFAGDIAEPCVSWGQEEAGSAGRWAGSGPEVKPSMQNRGKQQPGTSPRASSPRPSQIRAELRKGGQALARRAGAPQGHAGLPAWRALSQPSALLAWPLWCAN